MMKKQAGFTLIETLMAMAIFTIGILALFGMQSAAITENVVANKITTGSTWAAERVERLISIPYNHAKMSDKDGDKCAGLDDHTESTADGFEKGSSFASDPPYYNIYWNVADDCTLTAVPTHETNPSIKPDEVQRPKHLRIIVTRDDGGKVFATFNYIKQNVVKKK